MTTALPDQPLRQREVPALAPGQATPPPRLLPRPRALSVSWPRAAVRPSPPSSEPRPPLAPQRPPPAPLPA